MARKRGGLAGLYDKNKGLFRTLASMGAGAFGGPLAGAAVGAAFRGLDREGKSGIGFDPFAALPGAVEGYMAGQTGQAIGKPIKSGISNVRNMLSAKKADATLNMLGGPDMSRMIGLTPGTTTAMGPAAPAIPSSLPSFVQASPSPFANVMPEGAKKAAAQSAARAAARTVPSSSAVNMPAPQPGMGLQFPGMGDVGRSAYGGAPSFTPQSFQPGLPSSPLGGMPAGQPGPLGRFPMGIGPDIPAGPTPAPGTTPTPKKPNQFVQALLNPQVLAAGVQGLLGAMPDAKSAAMDAQTKLAQQQFDEDRRRFQMEEERKRRIAELLMPYMQQNFPQYLGGR